MRFVRRVASAVKRKAAAFSLTRLAQWSLTSYLHLAATVAGSFVVMILLSFTMATVFRPAPDPADAASSSSASPSASPSFPMFTENPEPDEPQETTGSRRAAKSAAVEYVDTYLDTSGGRVAWLMRLRELSTPQLSAGLAMVDPDTIRKAPTGRVRIIDGNGVTAKVRVQVDTKQRTPVDVYLTWDGERWVAADLVVVDR